MFSFLKYTRSYFFLTLLLLVTTYSCANYFIIKLLVSPRHLQIERYLAQQEMERFIEALVREEKALETMAHDWSAWDDTYRFVQDSNQEYIVSNLPNTTFTNSLINLLYIYRLNGSVVWGKMLDLNTEDEILLSELPTTGLPSNHALLLHQDVNSAIKGLIKTEHGPLLIASHPITTSENKGPIIGAMMFGRLLTESFLTKLKKQTQVQCRLIGLEEQDTLSQIPTVIPALGPDTPFVFNESSDNIFVYSLLHDYLGNPLWLLEIDAPRTITSQSRSMLRYVLFSNIFIGFLTLLLLLLLYRKRLREATSAFRDLVDARKPSRENEQPSHPLSLGFDTDEISRLSDDLREMIASFEQTNEEQKNIITHYTSSRRQLNEQMVKEIKERLQIESDLHEIQKDLEELVAIRTEELQQTNVALQDEIEIRKKNEDELITHRQRLRALSSELIQVENRERRQLALELHDQIGQSLSAAKMYLDSLNSSISDKSSKVGVKLQHIVGIIDQTIQDVRTLTFELSPPILYELGIQAALEWLAEDFYKKYSLKITSSCETCPQCTPPAFRALIFRTIRELLINVVRHANADNAEVDLCCTGNGVQITVTDDGCGMKNEVEKDTKANNVGFGLFSIRERAGNLGGKMKIDSQIDKGTKIIVTLPYEEVHSEPKRLVI